MAKRKIWIYSTTEMSSHGVMRCCVCGKKIQHGRYRYYDSGEAYVTQCMYCGKKASNWRPPSQNKFMRGNNMNTEQLTKLASFAGKSANEFWMSTGKKPTDVIADLALALVEAQEKVQALATENAGMRSAIDFATAEDMWVEQHDGMLDYRYVDWYGDVLKDACNRRVSQPSESKGVGHG